MNRPFRLAFFTGNRSEFGLLWPVIQGLASESDFTCRVFAGGTHLSSQLGNTIAEVQQEAKASDIPVVLVGDMPHYEKEDGVLLWLASFIPHLVSALRSWRPDAFFVLGDRVEAFTAAFVSFLQGWVTVHIGGGNITSGGTWDDSLRHGITKLAHIHFVTCKENANNVLALGEEPWRVHITGSPAVERILGGHVANFEELAAAAAETNKQLAKGYLLFSFHPDTSDEVLVRERVETCLEALVRTGQQVLITGPNGDPGSEQILEVIYSYLDSQHQLFFRHHLGARLYLAALRFCTAVVGNSSSGLTETPIFRKPAIDIGHRQRDRTAAQNVVRVPFDIDAIVSAIRYVQTDNSFIKVLESMENPFDCGQASKNIARVLPKLLQRSDILIKKWSERAVL